jgi:ribosomal protein L21E
MTFGKRKSVSEALDELLKDLRARHEAKVNTTGLGPFKQGDKVIITRAPSRDECLEVGWVSEMKAGEGKKGVVMVVADYHKGQGLFIRIAEEAPLWWPSCVVALDDEVEVVNETVEEPKEVAEVVIPSFEVGDTVRITRKATPEESGSIYWDPEMDRLIGSLGTITDDVSKVTTIKAYRVKAETGESYSYPAVVLEKMSKWKLKKMNQA